MNELFEKIYAASNINTEESKQTELFEQIYKEAEMLNEMNPKLRAMLLGGALAAGLGMQSCSMPTDIPYDPPVIEQPAPTDETPTDETPGEETPETPGETPDNPDNPDSPDDTNPGTDDESNEDDEDDENNETEENKEVTQPTLEDMFGPNDTAAKNALSAASGYMQISDELLSDIFDNYLANMRYKYENGTFNKALTKPNSFNGYAILAGDYAFLIPNEAMELFIDILRLNN